jgi:hypothetical protein
MKVAPELSVTIVPWPGKRAVNNLMRVRFTNHSHRTLYLLRPLDGSEWGWHMPHYHFTVRDLGGPLKLASRCKHSGLYADRKWPGSYLIELGPRRSHLEIVRLPHKVPRDAVYEVSFAYVFHPVVRDWEYPASLWQGTVRSRPLSVRLQRQ